jgi:hypothetical protein
LFKKPADAPPPTSLKLPLSKIWICSDMQIKTFVYQNKKGSYWLGDLAMDHHIQRMVNDGWELMNSANDTGHVRVGKTLLLTGLTGGVSLLFGASRTAPTLTLTFKRDRPEINRCRCSSCGEGVAVSSLFCPKCGVRLRLVANVVPVANPRPKPNQVAVNASQSHLATAGYAAGLLTRSTKNHPVVAITIVAALSLLLLFFWLAPQPSAARPAEETASVEPTHLQPLLDLPNLALRKRSEVEKAIGKPAKYVRRKDEGELADEADYPWGIAGYNQARLNFVILRFQTRPHDYQEAFRLLSLPDPRPPYVAKGADGTTQLFWEDQPFGTGYTCCSNLAFKSVWISSDWREMHLLILDLDAPEEWSNQQCTMYVQRTGLPLPKGAAFKGNPLDSPINSKTK